MVRYDATHLTVENGFFERPRKRNGKTEAREGEREKKRKGTRKENPIFVSLKRNGFVKKFHCGTCFKRRKEGKTHKKKKYKQQING